MSSYVEKLHNALCQMCMEFGEINCEICEFQRPLKCFGIESYVVREEVLGPDIIGCETFDGMYFCRVKDEFVAVATGETFLKLVETPWANVKDFFTRFVFDGSITEEIWKAEEVGIMTGEEEYG